MKIPYIKINQKNETFFVVKFSANELKKHVNFHFRDPYSSEPEKNEECEQYLNKIRRKGI